MEANHAVPRVFHPSVIAAVVTPQIIRPASFVAHYHVSLQISHTPFGRGVVQDAVSYTQDFSQSQANAQHFLDSYAVGTIHVLLQQEQPLRDFLRCIIHSLEVSGNCSFWHGASAIRHRFHLLVLLLQNGCYESQGLYDVNH
ncbi:hypothetical protein Moror_11321 [Moniliophthora roreri MCA 2997]|uniref:Uncharacterized protein n=1 Tax=Moniliophthora roreri (strain MCA 2997) TaxID=1381753 RepID=V2WXP4_MONRO|nr:hypothetical protein Moror_11321 [Moniliophthora roreri MCA 2997]